MPERNATTLPDLANVDRRMALIFGGLIFVLMLIVLVAGGTYLHGVMNREQDKLTALTTRVLANAVSRISFSGKYHARLMLEEIKQSQSDIVYLRLIDGSGQVLAHSDPARNDEHVEPAVLALVQKVISGNVPQAVRHIQYDGLPVREVTLVYRGGYDNAILGAFQVGLSETERWLAIRRGLVFISLVVAGLLVVGILVTWRLSAYFGNPIRQVARALDRERVHLRTLLQTLPDLVWLKDPSGVYLACNARFERFFGAEQAEIVGRTDYDFVDAELADFFREHDRKAMAVGGPSVNEEWITFADDGHGELLETIKTPMFAQDGDLIGVLGIGRDVTRRKQAEDELRQHREHLEELVEERTRQLAVARDTAEAASRAKSLFLANMSHELRTPLNAILGFAQILERDDRVPEDERRNIATINRSGQHLLSLINDVLAISRIEAGRTRIVTEAFDLTEVLIAVEEMIRLRAEAKGLAFAVERPPDLPRYLSGDAHHLRQVLINLLGNAVKYTDTGEVRLGIHPETDSHYRFSVTDTGPGLSSEDQERIFHAFFQTEGGIAKGEGTGLGLTISREFVRLMGGELSVESTLGRGSTFIFSLPLPTAERVSPAEGPLTVRGISPGQPAPRILVAEDHPDNRDVVDQLLRQFGCAVELVANGREAIRSFQHKRPDLILMDMRMPVLDGYQATRAIRDLPGGEELPIVALTASAFEEDRGRVLGAGCDELLKKPVEASELFGMLGRLLHLELDYAEAASPAGANQNGNLEALPAEVREALNEAALFLDKDSVLSIAENLRQNYPIEAELITGLMEDYRFDTVATLSEGKDRSD